MILIKLKLEIEKNDMVKLSASDVLFYEQNFMTLFDQASNSLEFAKAMNGK